MARGALYAEPTAVLKSISENIGQDHPDVIQTRLETLTAQASAQLPEELSALLLGSRSSSNPSG